MAKSRSESLLREPFLTRHCEAEEVSRSNPGGVLSMEIATHLSGARNDNRAY